MARRALGPAGLAIVQAVQAVHRGEPVLVACSGGADSLALALAVRAVAARSGCEARALVVDHGLQPDSARHSQTVVAALRELGLPASQVAVDVRADGRGLEAAAREARYDALSDALAPGERCYLGHTLDDQAETVLLGLARGSGSRSLAGMPAERDGFVRPLLGLRRAVTRQSCHEQGVAWWDDPHNSDHRFSRVRVRATVLPLLEAELGPGIAEALARTADLAREDADAMDVLASGPAAVAELDCAELAAMPPGLRHRVLRRWLLARGAQEANRPHVLAVAALVTDWHGQKWVEVPGLRVARRAGRLTTVHQLAPESIL